MFIQQREAGYRRTSVAAILREFCSHTDGATMSGKKDALVNIGGWLALNDRSLYEEASNRIGQVEYLGEKLSNWGVPIVHPVGGQAIFLDARAFYPQISQESSRRPNR